ncbi:hypothetical protein F5890DRAFT_1557967 [Lentinula detonsa]|uniref:Uncharacterized protein n=1 Tax=Lentinula detonsa TaxID=2804962 RepID=A0AA38PR50_9AGAR|nr:hypothetical protein F5890DRAFT_1557967 [Lentinula detonsa]
MFTLSSLRNMLTLRQTDQPQSGTTTPAKGSEHGSPVSQMAANLLEETAPQSPTSLVSGLAVDFSALRLEEVNNMPGSFLLDSPPSNDQNPFPASLEALEMIITVATLTADPIDTLNHSKLFTPAAEFYERQGAAIPGSVHVDLNSAMQGLAAVSQSKKPSTLPASRLSRQFARQSVPRATKSRTPSPTNRPNGRVEQREVDTLENLAREFDTHHAAVLHESFDAQSRDFQYSTLDKTSKWLQEGLILIETFEERLKYRNYNQKRAMGSASATSQKNITLKDRRDRLREHLKTLHATVCALYVPLIPEQPIEIDANHLFSTHISQMDQLNQVLVLLAVICNVVIGLSLLDCNFLMGVAVLVARLGMSASSHSKGSTLPHEFSPSQNEIIADMPKNLPDAFKKLDVDGHFDLYATCPECSYTNKAHPLKGKKIFYNYPETCDNDLVGENGTARCGAQLLKSHRDGTVQPVKPFLVPSLPDYLARCLSDPVYVEQSKNATDNALDAIQTGQAQTGVNDVFEAHFIRDFNGPDGKLFVD